ncbi:MAG: DEAD/DEAH box helicase family protein [Desulfamplus sp.]|nr:DEAD/DEAH box helicase family protein [Desulfamplus sp.]
MELNKYQKDVINDLETYLKYYQQVQAVDAAFNKYWEDKIGPYDPVSGSGMRPYKAAIPKAAQVCLKVPTAGGKTFIACNALKSIFNAFAQGVPKVIVWLVPWSNLLEQTKKSLSNPDHPYCQKLNSLFSHRVEVYEKSDLLYATNFNPSVVNEQVSIFVLSFASLRIKTRNKEDRKIYQENGYLSLFADLYKDNRHILEGTDETALINVIRLLNPVVIVDESHNAESDLSVEMIKNLNPCFVLELTATPKESSNIISYVNALELKKHNMVKLPVIVCNYHDKNEVISSALQLREKLENLAKEEEEANVDKGRYIRPIVLFQAQPKTDDDNTTFEKVKESLLELQIPEEQIKIKTANINELSGVVLSDRNCPVRYIITVNALKEGWDCPFAYILASLANKSSAVDVEQILGRILRQPYVAQHKSDWLNSSYVLTSSSKFHETLNNIVAVLQKSGFSGEEYRAKDKTEETGEEAAQITNQKPQQLPLIIDDEINPSKIYFNPNDPNLEKIDEHGRGENTYENCRDARLCVSTFSMSCHTSFSASTSEIQTIGKLVESGNEDLKNHIENRSSEESEFPEELKVRSYEIKDGFKESASKIVLPQFYLTIPKSEFFNNGLEDVLLNRDSLLEDFKLSNQDINIDFNAAASELYKVDLEQTKKDTYIASLSKLDEPILKESVIKYLLSRPKDAQIESLADTLTSIIGNIYPIPDHEIRKYIQRILESLDFEQLHDIIVSKKYTYRDKIKAKIQALAEEYAEEQFNKYLDIDKIFAKPAYRLPDRIIPAQLSPSIAKSLYLREGSMNMFEAKVIVEIAALPNIAFWHRNLERGKGFCINGFKSNHYPDFMVVTKSGRVVVIETKGDDRDNSDSEAKNRLGKTWANKAGANFKYFMVFDKQYMEDTLTLDQLKERIKEL